MCIDPGFIPKGYKADCKALAAPFETLEELENAFKDSKTKKISLAKGKIYDRYASG